MITLVSEDFSQPIVQQLLDEYVTTYKFEAVEVARQVIYCCIKLRPNCSSYHKNVVETILNKATEAASTSTVTIAIDTPTKQTPPPSSSSSSSSSSLSSAASSPVDLENDLLCKVFVPECTKKINSRQEASKSGEKNDARYVRKQLDTQRRASVNNPFRLAVEKTRLWGQKEKKRSIINLRQALDLNYGHEFDGFVDSHGGTDCQGDGTIVKQDSLLLEGERISLADDNKVVTIEVTDIKLRGVASASYFSKPKPYVVFQCAETREKTTVSKAIESSCEWGNESFKFELERAQFYNGKFDKLQVWVFDKEFLRRKNHIGNVCISLAGINVHEIDNWFALEGIGGDGSAGEIHLCISFVDTNSK